jgi:signal transduction histidine kinase/BarA-like signal transduction histidine kinase
MTFSGKTGFFNRRRQEMAVSQAFFIKAALPVVGICILLSLAIAAYFEPKKDFSRRIFLSMLYSCAMILLSEGIQWLLQDQPAGWKTPSLWTTMFVFYAMLSILCYYWTVYSYYWFNNNPPSGKAVVWFLTGPVLEIVALICNFFNGSIFTISAGGYYNRGGIFPVYIVFSYLYMIEAILITAFRAAKKDGREHRQDYIMFLLCFLFPILGPIVQYAVQELPLMGVSEAIALLIVYVSIQQRTNARYAVERARYQDEYREYEETMEQLLTESADALCVLRLNLTDNTHSGEHGLPPEIAEASRNSSIDELFRMFSTVVRMPQEAEGFRETLNRENLLKTFAEQKKQLSLKIHRRVESGETHLIHIFVNMLKNPADGDVEAIVYSVDIDRQEKEEKVISAVTNRGYDFIALIGAESGTIHYQYTSSKSDASIRLPLGDYDDAADGIAGSLHDLEEPGTEREKISFHTVVEALHLQGEYSYVCECSTPSGEKRQKNITYQYLDDGKTEILFLVSDITEETKREREHADALKKALKEARHADAMKTEFLSNVSHDMRTPLNAILGYTHLAENASESGKMKEYLAKIGRAGNIMLSLVNDTLDLSKIESGDIILRPIPTDFSAIREKITSVIAPAAEKKHIRFVFDGSGAAGVTVLADEKRVQEIIINLLSNAIKFTPENGRVELLVECLSLDEHRIHDKVTVRDTGCGMKPEFLPKIFEPFAQEHQTSDADGFGLGLSIVKKLVDVMNGRIEVKSEVGKGTEFTLFMDFERTEDRQKKNEQPEQGWESLKDRRILLVEDNMMNTEIARALLEEKGMEVICAENGKAACDAFISSAPGYFDAVLMDIRMPVMNGYDAARSIRNADRADAAAVPIIAMSADAFDDDIRRCMDAGMNGHVSKPVSPEKLYGTLSRFLAK